MMGVYEIRNLRTGQKYIGSSKNIEERWAGHLSTLRNGRASSKRLQKAWNSGDPMQFRVLKLCKSCDLREIEEKLIKKAGFMAYNDLGRPKSAAFYQELLAKREARAESMAEIRRHRKRFLTTFRR